MLGSLELQSDETWLTAKEHFRNAKEATEGDTYSLLQLVHKLISLMLFCSHCDFPNCHTSLVNIISGRPARDFEPREDCSFSSGFLKLNQFFSWACRRAGTGITFFYNLSFLYFIYSFLLIFFNFIEGELELLCCQPSWEKSPEDWGYS